MVSGTFLYLLLTFYILIESNLFFLLRLIESLPLSKKTTSFSIRGTGDRY